MTILINGNGTMCESYRFIIKWYNDKPQRLDELGGHDRYYSYIIEKNIFMNASKRVYPELFTQNFMKGIGKTFKSGIPGIAGISLLVFNCKIVFCIS